MGRANAQARQRARRKREQEKNKTKQKEKNVVHAGQRATLNGRRVVADGRGNWRPVGGKDRTPVGTYKKGEDRTATPAKANNTFRSAMGMKPATPSGRKPKATTAEKGTFVNQKPRSEAGADRRTDSTKTKTSTKPTPTKPTPTVKPTSTKTSTKSTTKSNQPARAGAGNGAPGAGSAAKPKAKLKVRGGNNKAGRTSRLESALAGVKKFTPKKKKK